MNNFDIDSTVTGYEIKHCGASIENANRVVILLPGRRQQPEDIYKIAEKINADQISWIIPSAPEKTWYPRGFMRDQQDNQPNLDLAMQHLDNIFNHLKGQNVGLNKILIMGFSQGACIAARYLALKQQKLKAAILLTGGLFGPELDLNIESSSSLSSMPILLTGSEVDTWVPASRVEETASYFKKFGADVETKIYKDREHLVCDDEITLIKKYFL